MSTAIAAADSNDDAFLAALQSAGIPTSPGLSRKVVVGVGRS